MTPTTSKQASPSTTSAASGRLSPKSPPEVTSCGSTVSDLAVSPNGKSAYVPTGADCDRVYQFDIGADGALSPKNPAFLEVLHPIEVVVSPDSRSVYVTNASFLGRVYEFDVNAGGGALTEESTFGGRR